MLIKIKGKKLTEYDRNVLTNRSVRQHEDRVKGLSKAKGASFGDFRMCREVAKQYQDFTRFPDKRDRAKIQKNIDQIQQAERNKQRRQ